jgi:hypothetical protein
MHLDQLSFGPPLPLRTGCMGVRRPISWLRESAWPGQGVGAAQAVALGHCGGSIEATLANDESSWSQLHKVAGFEGVRDGCQARADQFEQDVVRDVSGGQNEQPSRRTLSRWLLRKLASFVTTTRACASAMVEICRSVDRLPSGSDEV